MTQTTKDLLADYRENGVIRVRQLFSEEQMQQVREALRRYENEVVPSLSASDVTFEADGKTVRNLWRMDRHATFFAELARQTDLVNLVRELLQGEPVLMGVETFNKPAKVGSGVPAHQDNAYFCRTPPDVLTVWIAVDPVTNANGPVFYVRGTHDRMRRHRPSGVSGNSMGLDEAFDDSDPFVGTLASGDALLHHCQVIHYSAPNRTDAPRCGLLMVFRAEHAEVDETLKFSYRQGGAAG